MGRTQGFSSENRKLPVNFLLLLRNIANGCEIPPCGSDLAIATFRVTSPGFRSSAPPTSSDQKVSPAFPSRQSPEGVLVRWTELLPSEKSPEYRLWTRRCVVSGGFLGRPVWASLHQEGWHQVGPSLRVRRQQSRNLRR